MTHTVAIVQARMGSSRLPGKSLEDLGGHPVVEWTLRRAAMAALVDDVVLATTSSALDDELDERARASGWATVRGESDDVLARYAQAIHASNAEVVVRLTGDCPFIQPALVDDAVRLAAQYSYVYTGHRPRLPRGFDVEAIHADAVLDAARAATDSVEREHVTPFIARRPERFSSVELPIPAWAQRPDLRFTIDERPDLDLVRRVVDSLNATPETLDGRAVIELLDRRPEIAAINRTVRHNTEH